MTGFRIEYDPRLPITAHRAEIIEALDKHSVIVVCGATGSGKSTQLPKICLEAGRGVRGIIGHTQPRRIAARALAGRIAEELGTPLGGGVGYQVRFTDHSGPRTRVKLMTDGILLKALESDRRLNRYDTLIIDEAHERSLNIDLLLGILKQLTQARADLKVIVTSATIDPQRFAAFFDGAPIIEVSGRGYPVEVRYRPLAAEDEDAAELSLPEGIVAAVRELDRAAARGDVLVFLPGEKHIREAGEALEGAKLADTDVLQLFARLSARDQERIFETHTRRRIVLATNVAETSLTVPGIRYVIDSGLARISRYSLRGKVQRLPIEPISQASADQRKGRCGRESEGICIRLYAQEDFEQRELFTSPEILRTNLASVILRLAVLNLGEPETFPFLDPPDNRSVNDGVRLLQELKAMDDERRVTSLGRRIAALPLDPRLARMLFAASRQHCLTEMLIIASFLEIQDPRERPADAQKAADEKHAELADQRSDFIAALNLWRVFNQQAAALSGNQLRRWCREHFLSFMRMREWQELHAQLAGSVKEQDLRANAEPAHYSALHQAILTGFLGSIGQLDERREYVGARSGRFVIAPGTPLANKRPRWVVAGSLVETTRLYARMVASVQPQWIEAAGAHLLKRNYSDPHWVESQGFVAAYESVTLFGLTLVSRRRISYGAVAPVEAREIFAREALAEGRLGVPAPFLEANRRLRAEVERMEAKIRRRDILVDEQTQTQFYLARIPERMSSVSVFERWRAEAERANPQLLFMTIADLMERDAPEASSGQFPDELIIHSNRLPLLYRFEPTVPDDGVTLVVPELLVELLDTDRLAWLVPGLRLEKITAALRALPKALRKQFVPVPEHARAAFDELTASVYADDTAPGLPSIGFSEWMARWITRYGGAPMSASDISALQMPELLRLNYRIIDSNDGVLAESRDLAEIKRKFRVANLHVSGRPIEPRAPLHREWDFGALPESTDVTRGRLRLLAYPALEDRGTGVALVEARTALEANALTRRAIVRLATLALPQQAKALRKIFGENRELVLLSQGLALENPLADALLERAFRECFVPDDTELPRDRKTFEARLDARRSELHDVGQRLMQRVAALLKDWRAIRTTVHELSSPIFANAVADIERQLDQLLSANFIETTPQKWFDELPRYLKAIARRLERLPGNVDRDTELARRAGPFAQALRALELQPANNSARSAVEQLRWMIEEFRVSLYAQDLRTALPVSEKRLTEQLDRARAALRG